MALVLVVFSAGSVIGLREHGLLQSAELSVYDMMSTVLLARDRADSDVTVVLMDERDIGGLQQWPIDDERLGKVLKALLAMGPRVVGVDLYRDIPVPPGHVALNELWRTEQRLVAIEKFPERDAPGVAPPDVLAGTDRVGFADLLTDDDGVVRRSLLFQSVNGRTGYAFGLRLAIAYLGFEGIHPRPAEDAPQYLVLGRRLLRPLPPDAGAYVDLDNAGYQLLLQYSGARFPTLRLRDLRSEVLDQRLIQDRVVILGVAAESVKDDFLTPGSELGSLRSSLPGALVHAHAVQQLIDYARADRAPLRWWGETAERIWVVAWSMAGVVAGWFAASALRWLLALGLALSGAILVAAFAMVMGWWIPLVPNLAAWMLAVSLGVALIAQERRREQRLMRQLFATQVSPQVARTIWNNRRDILEGGRIAPREMVATTLFADLQGFTRVSDELSPGQLLEWLNTYLSLLTEIVMTHGGVLDDYAGDGIKANFGVPVSAKDSTEGATAAVDCALAMCSGVVSLNDSWTSRGGSAVGVRVGIHTGDVVAGTVGSAMRMKFTTIGRNVNLASRLESLSTLPVQRFVHGNECCRVLVSAQTAGLVRGRFALRAVGSFELKGIREPVEVFQVTGLRKE
jgi:adenylate cyclase